MNRKTLSTVVFLFSTIGFVLAVYREYIFPPEIAPSMEEIYLFAFFFLLSAIYIKPRSDDE